MRNINPDKVSTIHKLECVIRDQLFDEISRSSFDIGYIQRSHTVTIRSKEDLLEVWSNMKKVSNIILWCDGLKSTSESKKGATSSGSSEDEEEIQETVKRKGRGQRKQTKKRMVRQGRKEKKGEDKDKKVQATIDQLTAKHGDKTYTPMQYRVWAEVYLGGVHPSLDSPPTSTMFNRAGGGGGSVKRRMGHTGAGGGGGSVKRRMGHTGGGGSGGSVKRRMGHTGASEIVSVIGDLTCALPRSPRLIPSSSGSTSLSSPAKMIDNCTKCYKQLADLKSLFENNVLSQDEYDAERSIILGVLKKLV